VRLTVIVAVVTIAVFGAPLAIGVAQYLISDQYAQLERTAGEVAIAVSGDLNPTAPPPGSDPDLQVAVYDAGGDRVNGAGPERSSPLVGGALDGLTGTGSTDGRLGAAVPVSDGDAIAGAVLVTVGRSVVFLRIGLIWLLMLLLAAAALLLAWMLAKRQASRLVRPLQALSVTAERLGGGDFSVRTESVGIAEIDSVNESVNRTAVRLGNLVERERSFSADASHQLRTPLTGLRLHLEAALDQPDADLRAAVGDALVATDQLQATITEILRLARAAPSVPDLLDVDALLTGIRLRWHSVLAAKGKPLRLAITGTPHPMGETSALNQILDVLIDNADRHGAGAVGVTVRALDDAAAIDVSDEGPALSEDPAELFGRATAEASGHGFGLALARRLTESQGGRLHLSNSDPPTFTVLLPAAHPDHSGSAQALDSPVRTPVPERQP
jgi:signal transduction histidine kinase